MVCFGHGGWIDNGVATKDMARRIRELLRRETQELVLRKLFWQEHAHGTQTLLLNQFDRTSVGDRIVSRDLIPFMRSRNIEFVAKRVKPLTKLYAFFDGQDVTKYCVPKLLEISMIIWNFPSWRGVVEWLIQLEVK